MPALARPLLVCLLAVTGGALAQVAAKPADDAAALDTAIAALAPERPGTVEAFVVVASLDRDPVFDREAKEAGRVLARRFGADGHVIVLGADTGDVRADARGTPSTLAAALTAVAARINRREDVLVLYTTSHGTLLRGVDFNDPARGRQDLLPAQVAAMLAPFDNRLVIVQACFSGQFVPALAAPRTIVATAASATASSFGCTASNDWTFFGHALINTAFRQPDTFARQFRRAAVTIMGWEKRLDIPASSPQISIGRDSAGWLAALDAHAPAAAGPPTGRPPSELQQ